MNTTQFHDPSADSAQTLTRWTQKGLRSLAASIALALSLHAPQAAAAMDHPNLADTLAPTSAFSTHGIDAVSLFNGSLSLSLPIGPSYTVSNSFSYGLALTYGSNVWQYEEVLDGQGNVVTQATPDRFANAGLGWFMSYGELIDPNNPVSGTGEWVFVNGGGGSHVFYDDPKEGLSDGVDDVWYTRDGSYLRMTKLFGGEFWRQIEFPNGQRQIFSTTGSCNDCWVLREVRSAFDDVAGSGTPSLTIIRDRENTSETIPSGACTAAGTWDNRWYVEDVHGKSHCVYLKDRIHLGETVDRVELAGPGGSLIVYQLKYKEVLRNRSCKDSDPNTSFSMTLPLLTEVLQPDGTSYSFLDGSQPAYNNNCATAPARDATAQLYQMQLPTLGFIEWTYGERTFPVGGEDYLKDTSGVVKRTAKLRDGSIFTDRDGHQAVWHYTSLLKKVNGSNKSNEVRVHVVSPTGECTKNYFAADVDLDNNNWTGWEYGLPHTLEAGASYYKNGSPLSRQVYSSNDQGSQPRCSGTKLRSSYQAFEHDQLPDGKADEDKPRWYSSNRRGVRSYTQFHDDGNRYIETERSDFDGLGNYRQQILRSNFRQFGTPAEYETVMNFNRTSQNYKLNANNQVIGGYTALGTSEPWVLGVYDSVENTADANESVGELLSRTEANFADTTGFLSCQRVLLGTGTETQASNISRGTADTMVFNTADADGNLIKTQLHGGDLDAMDATYTCSGSSSARFKADYTVEQGVVTKHQSSGINSDGSSSVKRTLSERQLDTATGWVGSLTDENGLTSTITYDNVGRVERITSDTGSYSETSFVIATGATPAKRSSVRKSPSGETLSEQEVELDDFGRTVTTRSKLPDDTWSEQFTTFDASGRLATVSDPLVASQLTEYLDYDAFGRARRVVSPKDKEVLMSYFGSRKVIQTVDVASGSDANGVIETPVVRETYFDALGRMYRAVEFPDPANQVSNTIVSDYRYDVGGRMTSVEITATDGTKQGRYFDFDRRGFLYQEEHPELGDLNSAGSICRSDFDAAGKAWSVVNGSLGCSQPVSPSNLDLVFDAWGRLEEVRDANLGFRPISQFTYDNAVGLGAGKMETAVRHNYLVLPWLPGVENNVKVTETYQYLGVEGAISTRDTVVETPSRTYEFTQGWQQTDWGATASIDYPTMCHNVANCPFIEPNRSVHYTFDTSYLQTIDQTLDGLSSSWMAAPIDYHSNGSLAAIHHANGVTDRIDLWKTTDLVGRPRKLFSEGAVDGIGANADWSSGVLQFDSAGNLKLKGSTEFLYDGVGRVKKGGIYQVYQEYEYDDFGNITEIAETFAGNIQELRTFGVYADSNRLSSANYDLAGRMTAWGPLSMTYDPVGQIAKENGDARTFYYTASDERIGSVAWDGSQVTERTFTIRDLSNVVLREYKAKSNSNSDWKVEVDYVHGPTGLLASEHRNEGIRHFHNDHLGSARLITDDSAMKVGEHQYFPYGEEYQPENFADDVRLQFTGHERDLNGAGTTDDLDYMHARYYSPHLSRFTRPDPLYGSVGTSQSWNRYMYVTGNPITFVDPDGQRGFPSWGKVWRWLKWLGGPQAKTIRKGWKWGTRIGKGINWVGETYGCGPGWLFGCIDPSEDYPDRYFLKKGEDLPSLEETLGCLQGGGSINCTEDDPIDPVEPVEPPPTDPESICPSCNVPQPPKNAPCLMWFGPECISRGGGGDHQPEPFDESPFSGGRGGGGGGRGSGGPNGTASTNDRPLWCYNLGTEDEPDVRCW